MWSGGHVSVRLTVFVCLVLLNAACFTLNSHVDIHAAWLVDAEGIILEMEVGSCGASHRIDIDESDTRVEILVSAGRQDPGDCADGVRVTLDAPLGDRLLIDLSDGEEVEVVRD